MSDMTKHAKLTKNITEAEFDRSYWYVNEVKALGKEIGIINSSKLRKDELEQLKVRKGWHWTLYKFSF